MPSKKRSKKSFGFDANTPQGKAAETVLHKIEQEFPSVQMGRAKKHDLLNNGGKFTRLEFATYAGFQLQSKLESSAKSRAKIKARKTARDDFRRIRDTIGVEECLDILGELDSISQLIFKSNERK